MAKFCSECGEKLESENCTFCPNCGEKIGNSFNFDMLHLNFGDSMDNNEKIITAIGYIFSIIFPLSCFFMDNLLGMGLSYIFSIVGMIIGFYIITRGNSHNIHGIIILGINIFMLILVFSTFMDWMFASIGAHWSDNGHFVQ